MSARILSFRRLRKRVGVTPRYITPEHIAHNYESNEQVRHHQDRLAYHRDCDERTHVLNVFSLSYRELMIAYHSGRVRELKFGILLRLSGVTND